MCLFQARLSANGRHFTRSHYAHPNGCEIRRNLSAEQRLASDVEEGCSFHWLPGKRPYFVMPSRKRVTFKVEGNVPFYSAMACNAVEEEESYALPAEENVVDPLPPPEPEAVGEGEADEKVDRRAEATSIRHLMTHEPKNKYCQTCQRAKITAKPTPQRKDSDHQTEYKEFGDLITGDHFIG